MKRLLMGFAACALIMTSCNKQEIIENVDDGQGQLSFTPGLGKQSTRASEWTNTLLQGAAIEANPVTLYAYKESATLPGTFESWFGDDLFYDTNIKGWKIGSTRFRNTAVTKYVTYFPKTTTNIQEIKDAGDQSKTTFETATFALGKFPAFKYVVAATSNFQEDLLAGVTEIKANVSNITIGMRHILSQVNFGTVGYEGAEIAIRNIQIVGLANEATYTYGPDDKAPVGKWGDLKGGGTVTYTYYDFSNVTNANLQPATPIDAVTGDRYIFGDGGNWGPGKETTTFYPIGNNNDWGNHSANSPTLANSLMLIPQPLTATTKVTFEYQIKDIAGAFVAGGPADDEWQKGEFKLDFSEGIGDTDYNSEWKQNMRYVYMIDFTDFLNGAALSFTVDVDEQPWLNHDGTDGEVDIVVVGQPTVANINTVAKDKEWYIATQTGTAPVAAEWAQVIRDEVWDMSNYDFRNIEKGQTLQLNFHKVIFNTSEDPNPSTPTTITMTLPDGYAAVASTTGGTPIKISGSAPAFVISEGDKSANAFITITNNNDEYSTSATLKAAIRLVNADATPLIYKGKEVISLVDTEPNLSVTGNSMTVKFNTTVVPTVGKTANGVWTWIPLTKTAKYVRD